MRHLDCFCLLGCKVIPLNVNAVIGNQQSLTTLRIYKSLLCHCSITFRSLLWIGNISQLVSNNLGIGHHRITSIDLGLRLNDSTLTDLRGHALSAQVINLSFDGIDLLVQVLRRVHYCHSSLHLVQVV